MAPRMIFKFARQISWRYVATFERTRLLGSYMSLFTADQLDDFVLKTDASGGPGSAEVEAYWRDFQYSPTVKIDQDLDPFSDLYFEQQIQLYRELSKRDVNPEQNELSQFAIELHIEAANPYASRDPSQFVMHYLRLGQLVHEAKLPASPSILDMGAGWGLSSEFFATLGATVTAVDINPDFVALIAQRQRRHRLPITSMAGSFDEFDTTSLFDAVTFYECLHHAIKPWELIAKAKTWLKPGGKILFAGEPINSMWKHWGLRLDALSVYCIRKYGWFESGWSQPFIQECFRRAGLLADIKLNPQRDVGYTCVATEINKNSLLTSADLVRFICNNANGWIIEEKHLISTGDAKMAISRPPDAQFIDLEIVNFRPRAVPLKIYSGDTTVYDSSICPGRHIVRCSLEGTETTLRFLSEAWIPSVEIGNVDRRSLSLHFEGATYS